MLIFRGAKVDLKSEEKRKGRKRKGRKRKGKENTRGNLEEKREGEGGGGWLNDGVIIMKL